MWTPSPAAAGVFTARRNKNRTFDVALMRLPHYFSEFRNQSLSLLGIRIAVFVFVAVMFVPHTGAIRTFSMYPAILLVLWRYLAPGRSRWGDLKEPVLLLFVLWLVLLLPSVFYSPDISYSLHQYHVSLLRALLLALLIYEGFRDPLWLNRLFQWLAWLALGMVLVFIYQIGVQLLNHGIGSVANWGLYRGFGDVLILLLPMAYLAARNVSDWRKPLFWLVAMLMISLTFATGSRGVLAAAVVAFVLLGIYDRNIKAFLMLLIALGIGFVLFQLIFTPSGVAQRPRE